MKKVIQIALLVPCFIALVFLSLSRTTSHIALFRIEIGLSENMYPLLEKARGHLPLRMAPFFCQADLQRIHTGMGKIWYDKGEKLRLNRLDYYALMKQSLEHYTQAIAINPHDILAVKGIAETTAALEFSFPGLFPGRENKYNAFPLFKRVLEVEPNGLSSNYTVLRYLHRKGMKEELLSQAQHAAKIYPSLARLQKEAFYSSETRDAAKKGFEQAITEKIMPATACFSLSALEKADREFSKSADYYKKGMVLQLSKSSANNHLNLGNLLLKAEKIPQANNEFAQALNKSSTPSKLIHTIYSYFKNQQKSDAFIQFALSLKLNSLQFENLMLAIAKAQMDQDHFEAAKETLEKIIETKENAKAYYLLAELARKEQDWDTMELRIQKATVLESKNGKYFNILADALIYQKKYRSAAEYMKKAIENDPENQSYKTKFTKIQSSIN